MRPSTGSSPLLTPALSNSVKAGICRVLYADLSLGPSFWLVFDSLASFSLSSTQLHCSGILMRDQASTPSLARHVFAATLTS